MLPSKSNASESKITVNGAKPVITLFTSAGFVEITATGILLITKMFFVMDACRLAKNPCLTKQGLVAVQSKLRLAVNLLIATLI